MSGFGLSDAFQADRVAISWPSGILQLVHDLPANLSVDIVEESRIAVDAGPDRGLADGGNVTLSARVITDDPAFPAGGNVTWTLPGTPPTVRYGITVEHDFPGPGTYDVRVTVRDRTGRGGSQANDTVRITVLDRILPIAVLELPQEVHQAEPAIFSAAKSTDNDPRFPAGATFSWTFSHRGESFTAEGAEIEEDFEKEGEWFVLLKVKDPSGNVGTYQTTFIVEKPHGHPPAGVNVMLAGVLVLVIVMSVVAWALRDPSSGRKHAKDDADEGNAGPAHSGDAEE